MTLNSIGGLYIFNPIRRKSIMGDKFGYRFAIRTERGVYDELESIGALGRDGASIAIFISQVSLNYWLINTYR